MFDKAIICQVAYYYFPKTIHHQVALLAQQWPIRVLLHITVRNQIGTTLLS